MRNAKAFQAFIKAAPEEIQDGEVNSGGKYYDVEKAFWYARTLRTVVYDIRPIAERLHIGPQWYGLPPHNQYATIDENFVEQTAYVSLAYPIIIGQYDDEDIILDGYHRIYKAVCRGRTHLPAKRLSERRTVWCSY